jgi:hypothetical protein
VEVAVIVTAVPTVPDVGLKAVTMGADEYVTAPGFATELISGLPPGKTHE